MQLLLAPDAWSRPFDPRPWQQLEPNASRAAIARGGYVHDRYETSVRGSFGSAIDRLLHYDVFPPTRMRAHVATADGRVALGATIVQRMRFGLLALEAAVRVIECVVEAARAQFAYATLEGHPEQGIASFEVRRRADDLLFVAQAWSRPGSPLARLGRPLARQLQRTITREALDHFRGRANPMRG